MLWLVNAGVAVGLLYVVMMGVTQWSALDREVESEPFSSPTANTVMTSGSTKEPVDTSAILTNNLFTGSLLLDEKETGSDLARQPKALGHEFQEQFPLRLMGTIAGDPKMRLAIIEHVQRKQQDVYQVGDRLDDVRIEDILQNRVILACEDGTRVTLEISLVDSQSDPSTALHKTATQTAQQTFRTSDVIRAVSDAEVVVNSLASGSAVSEFGRGLNDVSTQVDCEQQGIRIAGLADSTLGQMLGFQDGDVIQAINGHSLGNKRKAAQVLRKARKLGNARIELSRNDVNKTLVFRMGAW